MVNKRALSKATKRLVSRFHPERIILFGSQARGTADDRSDVDLLVIGPVKGKRRQLMVEMNDTLGGFEYGVDIVVLTPEEFERDRRIPGTVGRYAAQEGKVLYERG